MNTYKITNTTNRLAKRDRKFNTTMSIDYIDKMTKKTINIKPNDSVYLTIPSLPLSVHRLRIKNLIMISDVDAIELARITKKPKAIRKPKSKKPNNKVVEVKKSIIEAVDEVTVESQKKGKITKKV